MSREPLILWMHEVYLITLVSSLISVALFIFFFCRRDTLSWEDALNLASFLGEQLRNLHLLPCPSLSDSTLLVDEQKNKLLCRNGFTEDFPENISIPEELNLFFKTLNKKKEDICSRLTNW